MFKYYCLFFSPRKNIKVKAFNIKQNVKDHTFDRSALLGPIRFFSVIQLNTGDQHMSDTVLFFVVVVK